MVVVYGRAKVCPYVEHKALISQRAASLFAWGGLGCTLHVPHLNIIFIYVCHVHVLPIIGMVQYTLNMVVFVSTTISIMIVCMKHSHGRVFDHSSCT